MGWRIAATADVQKVIDNVRRINRQAIVIKSQSPITLQPSTSIRNLRVLVIEDGPTTTHGGMAYGAGYMAATHAHVGEIVDPRPFAVPEIAAVYEKYPHIGKILPAMGYYPSQLKALQETINRADVDVVVASTPCNLETLIDVNKPIIRAVYEFAEAQSPGLQDHIEEFLMRLGLGINQQLTELK